MGDSWNSLEYLNKGQSAKRSMAPKIQVCLNFIKQGGKKSVITEAFNLASTTITYLIPKIYYFYTFKFSNYQIYNYAIQSSQQKFS